MGDARRFGGEWGAEWAARWAEGRLGRGHGGGHGRGGRGVLTAGDLRLVLLKLISDEPRHGYDLIRAIEELTGGNYTPSPGMIYPALSVLQDMSFIDEMESEGTRRAFAVTDQGRAELAANEAEVAALFERLAGLANVGGDAHMRPVRRAMDNLRAVLKGRFASGAMGKPMAHEIAEIIDEAARRIERLEGDES
ncbi:PadR family transcriptional regulator [Afifella sp. IM 167]|nr:PadR family transcriptional regulator [Afifella sp. IM 167]